MNRDGMYVGNDGYNHCTGCGNRIEDWRDHSVACSRRRPPPLDTLVAAIEAAVIDYDASGDHVHRGSPVPGDCIRCNVVAALHPGAIARIEAARRKRAA